MDGVLPLWKPRGMTSHDCVIQIRKLFGTKKVGHTGTLDPEVEGVLAICIGQATKIVPYLTAMNKTYIAQCSLGIATDTEDAHGNIIDEATVTPPSLEQIEQVLHDFRGNIKQIPPMYSAVKVKGKKLYEYARQNIEVERPVRNVAIYELKLLSEYILEDHSFTLKVVCSEGTYIRTLCVDIGKRLGYPAHMSHLVRTEASSFRQEDTVTFAQIKEAKALNKENELLYPIATALKHLDRLYVSKDVKIKIMNGQKLKKPEKELKTDPFLMMYNDELLAIYEVHPKHKELIKPVRVFSR